MKLNWSFQRVGGGGIQNQTKIPWERYGYFLKNTMGVEWGGGSTLPEIE